MNSLAYFFSFVNITSRKIAEWGTAIQPACFSYDEANRMTSLTTFRATGEVIVSDPRERTDGDTTTWAYHDTTGLELQKTYADGSSVTKRYGAFNNCTSITDARGVVKTNAYDRPRGLLLRTTYSDSTTARAYTYNHLGRLTQVTDAAGTRTLVYNTYGELESNVLVAGAVTHTITEQRDQFGRSIGYTYAKNGVIQQTVTTGYAADGRIATAGFKHEGEMKQFVYTYLPSTNLLHTLTHPNGITLTQSYEPQRDLLKEMTYTRGNAVIAHRCYGYDAISRPTLRSTQRANKVQDDSFVYNNRSELVASTLGDKGYAYTYDNIGNRRVAQEVVDEVTQYETNELNQYIAVGDFTPQFDVAGNQTQVSTDTGIWSVSYNAENRPVHFKSEDGNTIIECVYDYMGRRATKKVTTNGKITLHHRYIYRGFLQIATLDLTIANSSLLWLILWDPSHPVASCPLAIQKDGSWYTYGWDLTKNICEVYGHSGDTRTVYTYSPYGLVSADGDVSQPIQWSSELFDDELRLVYYNYRYYNSFVGRWLSRDASPIRRSRNLYAFDNSTLNNRDVLGLFTIRVETDGLGHVGIDIKNQPWNFGRYIGAYMHDIKFCKLNIKDITGPLILRKGGVKDNEEVYEYQTSPKLENMMSDLINEIFNSGTEISNMDPSITDKLKCNESYIKNKHNKNYRYMGSDWGLQNNCATSTVDVIIAAAGKAIKSNDEELREEGKRLLSTFYTAYSMLTPSGMKSWLDGAVSRGIVKKK